MIAHSTMLESNQSEIEAARGSGSNSTTCDSNLTGLDAFLYGLPGGLVLAGLLFLCFVLFGQAIVGYQTRRVPTSASSVTRGDKQNFLGRRHKRGPPPSTELRPVDIHQMAMQENAPDDVRAVALAGMMTKQQKVRSKSS